MPSASRSPRSLHRTVRRRACVALVGVAVAALLAAGCIPPPPPEPPPVSPLPTSTSHAVGTRQFTFVDSTRATAAFGSYPGSPSRRLPTTVWYPNDGGGPFPLV